MPTGQHLEAPVLPHHVQLHQRAECEEAAWGTGQGALDLPGPPSAGTAPVATRALEAVMFGAVMFETVIFETVMFETVMFGTAMFGTAMFETVMFETGMFETIMFETVMFDAVMFEAVMFETVMFEKCQIADYGARIQDCGSPSQDSCPSLFRVHALPKFASEIIFAFGQPGKKLNFTFGGVDVSTPLPKNNVAEVLK